MPFAKTRKAHMSGSGKISDAKALAPVSKVSQTRKMNRLKDEVYREMLLLEVNQPGAEMGLALALLRAVVQSGHLNDQKEFGEWLRSVCPLGLHLIEASLDESSVCDLTPAKRQKENV